MRTYMSEADARRFNSFLAATGYNIKSFAERLGMSRATLSSRVNGRTDFSRCEMEKIAEILGHSPTEIFFS